MLVCQVKLSHSVQASCEQPFPLVLHSSAICSPGVITLVLLFPFWMGFSLILLMNKQSALTTVNT